MVHNAVDDEKIILELSVLQKAYPDEDTIWLRDIQDIFRTRIERKSNSENIRLLDSIQQGTDLALRKELSKLFIEKEKLQTMLLIEINGTGESKLKSCWFSL